MNASHLLFALGLSACLTLASPPCAGAPVSPPAQRLVVPQGAGQSYNTGGAIALGERYLLLGSDESVVKKPGSSQSFNNAGEVFVFDAVSGAYLKRLLSPALQSNETFGYAVAVSGAVAYITAPGNADGGGSSGIVYAIHIPTGRLLWKFSGQPGQRIGESIAVDADHLVVGGRGALDGAPTASGCLLHLNRLNGALLATYAPPVAEAFSGFGHAVAVCGGLAVCGAPDMSVNGKARQGRVTVIDLLTQQINTLTAADGEAQDQFGCAVAIANGRLLIGAQEADSPGKANVGTAYLFDAASLQLIGKINAPASLPANSQFGSAVALNSHLGLIGAKYDNTGNGSAWLLDPRTLALTACANRPSNQSKEFGAKVAMSQHAALIGDSEFFHSIQATNGANWLVRPLRQAFHPELHVVARSGDHAPGTLGARFASFGEAAVSPAGKIIHTATLKGVGVTSANRHGVWDNLTGTLDLVLRGGPQETGAVYGPSRQLFFNQQGYGQFSNRLAGGRNAALLDGGAYAFEYFREGQVLYVYRPGSAQASLERLRRLCEVTTCFASSSELVVNYLTASSPGQTVSPASDSHIANKQMNPMDEVCEGLASPIAGVNYGHLLPRVGVQGHKMVYAAALQNGGSAANQAVFVKTRAANDATLIARKGDPAPGAGSARFSSFRGEGIVNGKVLLRAQVTGGLEGLWSDRDGALKSIALAGQQAPGRPAGVTFRRFLQWHLTGNLDVAFLAQVRGPGVTAGNDTGVWFRTLAGNTFSLLQEGETAAGCAGAQVGPIQAMDVDAAGNYVLLTALRGASAAGNQALFLGQFATGSLARRLPVLALRKGSLFDRPGAEQLRAIRLAGHITDAQGCGSKGLARLLNASGAVFSLTFADGSQELVHGKP